jgi:tRNA-(ms[2]io[6]A)-hydroxylase
MWESRLPLKSRTPKAWAEVVLSDLDHFLLDHASCERKASALAMSFVSKYPEKPALVEPMIALALEELEHFHQVYKILHKRGLLLSTDQRDDYVNLLIKHARHGHEERLLDRLILSGVIEARGCERFALLSECLEDETLSMFYRNLANKEAGHYKVFLDIAKRYFPEDLVAETLDRFLEIEAKTIATIPFQAVLH